MDLVTSKVLRMLDEDTMAAPVTKPPATGLTEDLLTATKDHPVGDVSGKVKGPGTSGGGIETESQGDAQKPREGKAVMPHGMSEDALAKTPNAMGRMARLGIKY